MQISADELAYLKKMFYQALNVIDMVEARYANEVAVVEHSQWSSACASSSEIECLVSMPGTWNVLNQCVSVEQYLSPFLITRAHAREVRFSMLDEVHSSGETCSDSQLSGRVLGCIKRVAAELGLEESRHGGDRAGYYVYTVPDNQHVWCLALVCFDCGCHIWKDWDSSKCDKRESCVDPWHVSRKAVYCGECWSVSWSVSSPDNPGFSMQ